MGDEKDKRQEVQKPKDTTNQRVSLLRFAQILLPLLGIFAALIYFLGRLRTDAYYYSLGISPFSLTFSTEDYMFSSFNLVIMAIVITLWAFYHWDTAISGHKLFLGFFINTKQKLSNLIADIVVMIGFLFLCGYLTWDIFFNETTPSYSSGLLGIQFGMIIGVGLILSSTFLSWLLETQNIKLALILRFITISIVLLSILPLIANKVAEIEAINDLSKFPIIALECGEKLPKQIQSSPSNPNESTEVKLIITNNGMTYVLKMDEVVDNNWQIFAIPSDSIVNITYTHTTEED